MIDLSKTPIAELSTVWAEASASALSTTPPTPILLHEHAVKALRVDVVDGFFYAADTRIPVIFGAGKEPPPRVFDEDCRDLKDVKRERITVLQAAIRAYVDAGLPPSERETLAALLQRTTLMRLMGVAVDEGASLALVAALGWAETAMVAGSEAAARVGACVSADEVAAVGVDVDAIGPPPRITAGEVAARLRGAG